MFTIQIQLAVHPCDQLLLLDNNNMTDNIDEKHCFDVLNVNL